MEGNLASRQVLFFRNSGSMQTSVFSGMKKGFAGMLLAGETPCAVGGSVREGQVKGDNTHRVF
jgi:hypothetical protein